VVEIKFQRKTDWTVNGGEWSASRSDRFIAELKTIIVRYCLWFCT